MWEKIGDTIGGLLITLIVIGAVVAWLRDLLHFMGVL